MNKKMLKEELKELTKRAEAGDAQAQYDLGEEYYLFGDEYSDDPEKAFYWFEKAAEQGHTEAEYKLGHCLKCRVGTRYSWPEGALPYFLRAAEKGHVGAMKELFDLYSHELSCDKWDFDKAAYWIRKAAETGDDDAEYELGKLLIEGFWFKRKRKDYDFKTDPAEGVKWLLKSAEQNNFFACDKLGDCYLTGTGVEKDEKKAMEWYEKGSDQRYGTSKFKLGEIYLKGELVEQDYKKAFEYFNSCVWDAQCLKRVGDCYYHGWGVEKDLEKAVYNYDCAVKHDSMDSYGVMSEVALIYARDELLHDEIKAVRLLRVACNYMLKDNPEILYERAKRHLIGLDFRDEECQYEYRVIRKDAGEAAYYFKRAAEAGHIVSQCEYGKCLLNGFGVEKDETEAIKWLKKAAKGGNAEAAEILRGLK